MTSACDEPLDIKTCDTVEYPLAYVAQHGEQYCGSCISERSLEFKTTKLIWYNNASEKCHSCGRLLK